MLKTSTFAKDTFSKTDLKMADACAKIFDLNPQFIYKKEFLLKALSKAIEQSEDDLGETITKFKHIRSSFLTFNDIVMTVKEAEKSHIVCILIAQNIKEKGKDSIFAKKAASKLIPDLVHAARFLVKNNLI